MVDNTYRLSHTIEHTDEVGENHGVAFDEVLELLDNWVELAVDARRMLDVSDHFPEPFLQHILVIRKPATETVLHPAGRTLMLASLEP